MSFTKKSFQEIRDLILDDIVSKGLITDRNVGGVARTLVEAYARETATLYESLQNVYDSGFVDTASGRSLEFVVSILGIERIKAQQAVGTVLFARQTPAEGDITIPKGTTITRLRTSASDVLPLFETTEIATLQRGEQTIEAPIRAQEAGEIGVVGPNELTVLPRPIVGIETVTNREATVLRLREENDEELRERAKNALRNTGKATQDAIEFALRRLGAQSVEIIDRPRGLAGEIEVIVDGEALDDPARQREIEDAINDTKAAGIDVNLRVTQRIHIFFKLRISLKNAILVQEELDAVITNISSKIEAYIASLELGEIVRRNGIISAALSNPNVLEVEFLPLDETVPDLLFKTGAIENGKRVFEDNAQIRKRRLEGGDIFIGKQERAVLDKVTDLIPKQDLIVKAQKFAVFIDFEDSSLVLVGDTGITQNQVVEQIRQNVQRLFLELATRSEQQERDLSLNFQTLQQQLQIEGYRIQQSQLKVVLLHSFDGLENTLTVAGQQDVIGANEVAELRVLDLQVNVVPDSLPTT